MSRIVAIIQRAFNNARQNLTYAGENEPIGKASLIIVLFLDFLILMALFQGLDDHTSQLTTPDEYIPSSCREMVLREDWNSTNERAKITSMIRGERNAQDYGDAERPTDHYPACIPLLEELRSLGQDKEVLALVDARDRLDDERDDLQGKLDDMKVSYDTTQAGGQNPAEVAKVRQEYEATLNRFNHLTVQLQTMDAAVDKNEKIAAFRSHIGALGKSDQEAIREASRSGHFWFPVKVLLMQLSFLLPLLIGFYFWFNRSFKKGRGIQTLISSHLLVVTAIPVALKLFWMIYDILPKRLLKQLWELLLSWNLVALWHYGVILVVVAVAGYLVYFFQKKLFSHEKLIERRIAKGCCLNCGKRLPHGDAACSSCGFVQQESCSSCGGATYKFARHCRCCGVERRAG